MAQKQDADIIESNKNDVLFQIEDEDGDKYEVVKYMGKVVAFDANPEELPGGGMGPYEYDPKTGTIETEHGPKKTRKIGDQTFEAGRDNEMDAALHKAFGIEGDFVPFDERPRDGEEIELQVPVRYTKAEKPIRDKFSEITGIDQNKISVEYTNGGRSVKIDGQTPHPEILSALNGTLDQLDTGGISGMYDDVNDITRLAGL
jgi:hypothetical protein